jgi:gliding motility-associated-like protein
MKLRFLSILFIAFICGNNYTFGQHDVVNSQIRFVENKNQWAKNVLYRADLPGGKLYAEKNKLTYAFYDTKLLAEVHDRSHKQSGSGDVSRSARAIEQEPIMRLHAFSVDFVGANLSSTIVPASKNPEKNNFYIGSDPALWASNVSSFGQLDYKKVYENIDLSVYETNGSMKYEFIVSPGGDPANIKLQYKGAENIYLENGALHIETSVNEIEEQAPYIYQTINGKEVKVSGNFVLTDSVVTFKITGKYSKKAALVIDPKLIFSTYSGSVADNWGNTATFDEAGNTYSGGTVFGVGYPTTTGAYQENFAGGAEDGWSIDVGILKYNPIGTGLLYATYLGGFSSEVPHSLIVNNNDELIIFGTTSSTNFPTSASTYDNSFNGGVPWVPISGIGFANGSDLFISKLSSDGSALLASTYIGGSGNDGMLYQGEPITKNYGDQFRGDVIVDDKDNIYVASNTRSLNFPVSPGALQSSLQLTPGPQNGRDACIFKMNKDLTALTWSTYLGGTGEDASYSIQIDSLYNVVVAGGTTSLNFPTTAGALHQAYQGGGDGFVARIKLDGTSLISSTYLGTTAYDQAYFVQLDSLENVYILGQTQGPYPVTPGTYNNPNSGQFIHKLSRDLTTSLMSTVVGTGGSSPNISLTAFLVNDCGNIFLSGWGGDDNSVLDYYNNNTGFVGGYTNGLPITSDAFQSVTDGSDFYIMVLSQNASSLLYATFFGGIGIAEHVDGGTSRFDKKGIIYEAVCAGCGGSNLFPTTPGAWSNTNNSYFLVNGHYYRNCNNAAFKFDLTNLKADFSVTQTANCSNTVITVTNKSIGGKTFFWDFGDSTTSNNPGPLQHTYGKPGNYTITLIATDLTTCIGRDTMKVAVVVPKPPVLSVNTSDTTICKGDSVYLSVTNNPTYQYLWSPAQGLSSTVIASPLASPDATTNYLLTVTDTNNCVVKKTVNVTVLDLDKTIGFANESDCEGKLFTKLSNKTFGAKALYNWAFGDGNASQTQEGSVVHEYKEPGTYTVYLTISSNGCSFKDTVKITLEKVFLPNLVTPNGDGLNDVYEIKGNSDNWTFEVYNRWGKLLYKNSNYHNEWAGEELSDGTYYYLVISPDDKRCKGWVQLVR